MDVQAALSDRQLEILRRLGGVRVVLRPEADSIAGGNRDLMTLVAKDELFANWLIDTGASAAVIRPDRYVYGVASNATELVLLVNNLARTLFS